MNWREEFVKKYIIRLVTITIFRRLGLMYVGLYISLIAIPVLIWSAILYIEYLAFGSLKFDSVKWKEASEYEDGNRVRDELMGSIIYYRSIRCKMRDDLIKNHLKIGITRQKVEEMLGKRLIWHYCIDHKIKCAYYGFGTCTGGPFVMWSYGFMVCFDAAEKLIAVSQVSQGKEGVISLPCPTYNAVKCINPEGTCFCTNLQFSEAKIFNEYHLCAFDQW